MMQSPGPRFDALDLVRGIAAIAVLLHHVTEHKLFAGAWVAVDLFFVLSGFIIAHSYKQKIANGMGFLAFLARRLIRLYPLHVFGACLGALVLTLGPHPVGHQDIGKSLAHTLLLMPDIFGPGWPKGDGTTTRTLFPLNNPSWSLFYELIANVIFFVALRRFMPSGRRATFAIAILLWVSYLAAFIHAGVANPGWSAEHLGLGLLRVTSLFYCGVAIFELAHQHPQPLQARWGGMFLGIFLVICLAQQPGLATLNWAVITPVTIYCCCKTHLPDSLRALATRLGEISFPLYITHTPVLRALEARDGFNALPKIAQWGLATTVCLGVAMALIGWDGRVRQWLTAALNRRSSRADPPA